MKQPEYLVCESCEAIYPKPANYNEHTCTPCPYCGKSCGN